MKRNVLETEAREQLAKAKQVRDDAFDELDRAVLEARVIGATFREISEVTGMSIAWVQQSLHRADPTQEKYSKRKQRANSTNV
jgi:DNA-directed RNA polymerase specialized sigma24 family protein